MKEIVIPFKSIGLIHSSHHDVGRIPIQPVYASGCKGWIEVFEEYAEGLCDLEGFSHIYLLYYFHKAGQSRLCVKPFLQDVKHGVFATRAPCRPNAIGLSIVELERREGNILHINNVDILDETPLLDIKPYTSRFDRVETARNGWQDEVDEKHAATVGRRGYKGL